VNLDKRAYLHSSTSLLHKLIGYISLPSFDKPQHQNLTPLSASSYFTQALEIQPPNSDTVFRTYTTPPTSGQGKGTYLICHHGAGASGLSFAVLGKCVTEVGKGELGVLSYDCRGHGAFHSHCQ
jgi:protein phosphatase methylesterase 1